MCFNMESKQKRVIVDFDGVLVNMLDMALAINTVLFSGTGVRPPLARDHYAK